MKRGLIFTLGISLILLTVVVSLWLRPSDNSLPTQSPEPLETHPAILPPSSSEEFQQDAPVPPVAPVAKQPAQKQISVSESPAPDNSSVIEFRVVDGLAIAYGDIILGRPEPGWQSDRGYYEASTPQLWDKPEIPYIINGDLPNPARVEKAIEYFRQNTPVNLVPYQGQKDALVFEAGAKHCFSALGRTGGLQPIRLSPGCQWTEIVHEIMHALGFIHEHSRPDRDQFVEVQWQNIDAEYKSQFAVVPDSFFEVARGTPFDYQSTMLYDPNAFAIQPGVPTLKSKAAQPISPVKAGLSEGDIKRLKRMYRL